MNFTFDNLSELDEFLKWAQNYRGQTTTTVYLKGGGTGGTSSMGSVNTLLGGASSEGDDTPLPTIDTSGIAFDTPQQALKGDHVALKDGAQPGGGHIVPSGAAPADLAKQADAEKSPAEPAKRKRRTKAEIEADEKANVDAILAKQNNDVAAGLVQEAQAAEPAAQPEGTNPFEQAATPAAEAASLAAEPAGADAAEDAVVTPFQHIVRGREFIAKHGMPKYNETFTKAGLDANVMAYTGYQRALHMAAMDELEKAG